MAQVVYPRLAMPTSINPTQFLAKLREHAMRLPVAKRFTPAQAARTNEERRTWGRAHMLPAQRPVGHQRADNARVQWHQA